MTVKRKWLKEGQRHWRCAPWTICEMFVDGCTMYVLSKDGESAALGYMECLEDARNRARDLEKSHQAKAAPQA